MVSVHLKKIRNFHLWVCDECEKIETLDHPPPSDYTTTVNLLTSIKTFEATIDKTWIQV